MTRLIEKPFSERLEALYKTRSYQLAVAVAETEQVSLVAGCLAGCGGASWRQWGAQLASCNGAAAEPLW